MNRIKVTRCVSKEMMGEFLRGKSTKHGDWNIYVSDLKYLGKGINFEHAKLLFFHDKL